MKRFTTIYIVIKDGDLLIWDSNMRQLHKQLTKFYAINYTYLTVKMQNTDRLDLDGYIIHRLTHNKK